MGEPRHYKIKKAKGYENYLDEYVAKEKIPKADLFTWKNRQRKLGKVKQSRYYGYREGI